MTNLADEVEPEFVRSFDDTVIAARTYGGGSELPLLICNGIGARVAPWRKALIDVVRQRPVVLWDLRGLFSSSPPASDRLDPHAHSEDAIAVMDHLGHDRFGIASWSSGSRIALEIAHRYPERVDALAIVCGTYGQTPGRVLRHLEIASAFPTIAGLAKHFASALIGPFRTFVARPELAGLIRQSGMVGPTAEIAELVELLREMGETDLRYFLEIYEKVAGSSARSLLDSIEAPTLLVAGARDWFAPARVMEEMQRSIPAGQLETYERATHYLPIEFPGKLSDDLRKFLAAA